MLENQLLFIPPEFSQHYAQISLDKVDLLRIKKAPNLATQLTWQTSRVGKHIARKQFPQKKHCISHKNDYSMIAVGNGKLGVDLEYIKKRNYDTLAKKIASQEEQNHIADSPNPDLDFYRLWTIKEALIKADNLSFPIDMKRVGFSWHDGKQKLVTIDGQPKKWLCVQLDKQWVLSVIYPNTEPVSHIVLYLTEKMTISHIMSNIDHLKIKQTPLMF